MRIGMIPIYYYKNLFAISCVNGMIDLAKGILENEERAIIYFYVMKTVEHDPEEFDRRLGDLRSRFIVKYYDPVYRGHNWHRDNSLIDKSLQKCLSAARGDYIDVLLNANLRVNFAVRCSFEEVSVSVSRDLPLLVSWCNDMTHPIKDGQFPVTELYQRAEVYGMQFSQYNQFLIPYELDLACEVGKRYLSFAGVKHLRDSAIIEPMGIDFREIDSVVEKNKSKRDLQEVNVFYGGSFAIKKRLDETVEIVKNLYRRGKPVKLQVTTQMKLSLEDDITAWPKGGRAIYDPDVRGFCDVEFRCDRKRFIDRMGDGDLFFCFTNNESMGLAYFEMLYSGMIGIFLDRPWLKGLLPEDYPFKVASFEEAEILTAWIVDNWNEARDTINTIDVQGFLLDRFGYRQVAKRWYNVLRKGIDSIEDMTGFKNAWITKIILNSIDDWKESFSLEYAYEQVRKHSEKGVDLRSRTDIITKGFFRRCLLSTGYFVDECTEETPSFRRIK